MIGYKYDTEQEVKDACKQCDIYYGIPTGQSGEVTQKWVDYRFAELNTPQFYYIVWNDTLNVVLGEPTEFEVIFPDEP